MSLHASRARLVALTKDLSRQWAETKEHWHDAKCLEFEQTYLVDLWASVDHAVTTIEQLEQLSRKIRSDCE